MYSSRKWYGASGGGGRRGTGGAGFTLSMNHYHHHYGMRDDFASNKIASNLVFLLLVGFLFFLSQFIIMSRLNPDSLINPKHHKNKYSAMENLNTGGRDYLIQKHIKEHEEDAIERNKRRLKFQQIESKTDILKSHLDRKTNQGQQNQEAGGDNSQDPEQKDKASEDHDTPKDAAEVPKGPNEAPKEAESVDDSTHQQRQPETHKDSETEKEAEKDKDLIISDAQKLDKSEDNQQKEAGNDKLKGQNSIENVDAKQVPLDEQELRQDAKDSVAPTKEETEKASNEAVQTDPLLEKLVQNKISGQAKQDNNPPKVELDGDSSVQKDDKKAVEVENEQKEPIEKSDVSPVVDQSEKINVDESKSNNEQQNGASQNSENDKIKSEENKEPENSLPGAVKDVGLEIKQANDASIKENVEIKSSIVDAAFKKESLESNANAEVQKPADKVEVGGVGLEKPAGASERKDKLTDQEKSKIDAESKSSKHSSEEM